MRTVRKLFLKTDYFTCYMEQNYLKKIAKELISSLTTIKNNGFKNEYSFEIDCELLKDFSNNDIRDSDDFKNIFKKLKELDGPVLYWFEILSETDRERIRKELIDYSNSKNSKATPALKKGFDKNTKCLYVGKVKKCVWGRMIQHFGFYKVNRTQGLQLFHWTKGLNLKLKVHLYEFEADIADVISIFEIEMAKMKRPLIGKHK